MPDDAPASSAATPADESAVVRVLRTQIVRSEVRLLELGDALAQRDTEGAATRELLRDAQAQLDLALSEVRSLTQQRDDLAAEIPHIRHHQHLAALELEKVHGVLRDTIREKDEGIARHHAAETQLADERAAHARTRAALEAAVHAAHQRIAALEQESAGRAAEVLRHAARIAELDAAIAHLQGVRTELEKLRDRLQQEGEGLRAELARTRDTLAQREAKLSAMQDSFSWKVTLPLRWLRRTVLRR